jgi:quercetin dioxygenase-like cupin family protein
MAIQRRQTGAASHLTPGSAHRRLAEIDTASLEHFRLEGSTTVPEPSHPEGQTGFILPEGGRPQVRGPAEEVRAGDSRCIPPGSGPAIASVPDEEKLVVEVLLRGAGAASPQAPQNELSFTPRVTTILERERSLEGGGSELDLADRGCAAKQDRGPAGHARPWSSAGHPTNAPPKLTRGVWEA